MRTVLSRLDSRLRTAAAFVVALTFAVFAPRAAEPADLHLTVANDPVAGSSRPDDLYTSDFGVELVFERVRVVAGERMFTDRERTLRFDETYLSVSTALPELAGWKGEASAGVLRAGRGLLGESAQNEVHDWIGSGEVVLPYIGGDHYYATLGASLSRSLGRLGRSHFQGETEVFAAPGFRSWLRAGIAAERPLGRDFSVRLGAGVRVDHVETPWLGDRVAGVAPTFEVGLAWRPIVLLYRYNEYGTRSGHLTLGVHVTP